MYTAILGHVFEFRPETTPSSDKEKLRKQLLKIKSKTRSGQDGLKETDIREMKETDTMTDGTVS